MIQTHILGMPRMGRNRELKFALEAYWKGGDVQEKKARKQMLLDTAKQIRLENLKNQVKSDFELLTVGDFSFYDHIGDNIQLFECEAKRFGFSDKEHRLDRLFTMARGISEQKKHFALEMTKWFDTNYHYLVPEFDESTTFGLKAESLIDMISEAKQFNKPIKVVLVGPVTFLYLGKEKSTLKDRFCLLEKLILAYRKLFKLLKTNGVDWVQMEEPILGLDLNSDLLQKIQWAYQQLHNIGPKVLLTTYFSKLNGYIGYIAQLPIDGLHLDCINGIDDIDKILNWLPKYKMLSLGLVNGRNIWKSDIQKIELIIQTIQARGFDNIWLAPSCSFLHVPYSFKHDELSVKNIKPWLSGVDEKCIELKLIKQKINQVNIEDMVLKKNWNEHIEIVEDRNKSKIVHKEKVQSAIKHLNDVPTCRSTHFNDRKKIQQAQFNLPLLPTTTIGSFPQTQLIRSIRKQFKENKISKEKYVEFMKSTIKEAIEFQELAGLDVLVHGEAERNDMVEFFGEQLDGFAFTQSGWVQSYGSRCVKPPILFGDVSRKHHMTVDETVYAQSLSRKPVKGMLTGPITMLQWSFVRDCQDKQTTAIQLALAIRDEVLALETAGIRMIQIDEPAFREGLPLRKTEWPQYLKWATQAFRLCSSSVQDQTQIHTHMCYSEFNDILDSIADLDADVISIETSRSDMDLLEGFSKFNYPNDIGPGVYDIHSPNIPNKESVKRLIQKAMEYIPAERLWINPDCGLKTRTWSETQSALNVMVNATLELRNKLNVKLEEKRSSYNVVNNYD